MPVNKYNNKDPNSENKDDLIFYTTANMWLDAFLAGRGGDFDNDDDGNNNCKDNDNDDGEQDHKDNNNDNGEQGQQQRHQRRGQQRPHFSTQQPTCGRMHSWQGGG